MARHPRSVDQAIARFDEMASRMDRGPAARRHAARRLRSAGRRVSGFGLALAGLIAATIAFGLVIGPIGIGGLFLVVALTILLLIFFVAWPDQPKERRFDEKMPNREVVRQLDGFLMRRRAALPAPAARRADAIGGHLPQLEARLAQIDPLDPLAQDARRLLGRHVPELIERYERVPREYRSERDAGGLTVDERLVAGLDAAHEAIEDLGRKLAHEDLSAFETQGRFLESRYKDGGTLKGE